MSLLVLAIVATVSAQELLEHDCQIGDQVYGAGEVWIHQAFFNVTCENGAVKVLNCVTERGTQLPLGTVGHTENGIAYSCATDQPTTTSEPPATTSSTTNGGADDDALVADECDNGEKHYTREGFVVECESNTIAGCVDESGDLVKSGYFLLSNGRLRYCHIYSNRKRASIQRKGCFNGTTGDDPEDRAFHVGKGQLWTTTDGFDLKCGDDGFFVYKCHVENGGLVHEGTAWIDKDNVFNVCK